jgi:hypothetical protein
VLDHLLEPLQTLQNLRQALVPGGALLLVTHDERSLLARLLDRQWPPFTLQHPQLYSRGSLSWLVKRAGFSISRVTRTVYYFPLAHLCRAALQIVGLPDSLVPAIESPTLGLRLGNIVLLTRKPDVAAG